MGTGARGAAVRVRRGTHGPRTRVSLGGRRVKMVERARPRAAPPGTARPEPRRNGRKCRGGAVVTVPASRARGRAMSRRSAVQARTKFTMRPGTTTTLRTVAPSSSAATLRVGARRRLVLGLGRARGDRDPGPHLAVTCTGISTVSSTSSAGSGSGKSANAQRARLAEPLPQLLGDVRRERREHQHHRPHDLARARSLVLHDPGEPVVQLHQRRRSRC